MAFSFFAINYNNKIVNERQANETGQQIELAEK